MKVDFYHNKSYSYASLIGGRKPMTRRQTEAAQVAKMIRRELKKSGIPAKVTSKTYSGGDRVNINLQDQPPWVIDAINSGVSKYIMGHFNGMEDIYEYSNTNGGLQVKFIFINNKFSQATKIKAMEHVIDRVNVDSFSKYDLERLSWEYLSNYNGNFGCYFKKPLIKITTLM